MMKKRLFAVFCTTALTLALFTGCGNTQSKNTTDDYMLSENVQNTDDSVTNGDTSNNDASSDTQAAAASTQQNTEASQQTEGNQESGKKKKQKSEKSSTQQDTSNLITETEAGKIALAEVSGATEADLRIHLDRDDGIQVYEGSIVYNEMEYEFEINAETGKIIDWEVESIYD